jgi:1-aminocyclopropane-1-carboxylate deaminase
MSEPGHILLQRLDVSGDVNLFVLRLDELDLYSGGNKFFKLKYNLEEFTRLGYQRLLTFGGAWSNHLAALAAHAPGLDAEIIAVVRGEDTKYHSDTLRFCREQGIRVHFVRRDEYARRHDPAYHEELRRQFGDFYLLPEGGSNEFAVKGCREIVDYINIDFDVICCPVGSGGTLAGISTALRNGQRALGFVALKGAGYLDEVITKLIQTASRGVLVSPNFQLIHDYHFGGFAKVTPELRAFKQVFADRYGFELDYVYTAKMFYGIYDLVGKGYFKPGTTIVALHTGGVQGNAGFES